MSIGDKVCQPQQNHFWWQEALNINVVGVAKGNWDHCKADVCRVWQLRGTSVFFFLRVPVLFSAAVMPLLGSYGLQCSSLPARWVWRARQAVCPGLWSRHCIAWTRTWWNGENINLGCGVIRVAGPRNLRGEVAGRTVCTLVYYNTLVVLAAMDSSRTHVERKLLRETTCAERLYLYIKQRFGSCEGVELEK